MPSMSTIAIRRPQIQSPFFHRRPSRYECRRIPASWTMKMDSNFSPTMNNNSNNKKKKELSVQLSTPPSPKVDTLRFCDLHFDRLQPSEEELGLESIFEFGQFVAREAVLDEEYWTAAWLRAESQFENQTCDRYSDHYKRKFVDKEYNAIKKRFNKVQNGEGYSCIITVKKEQKNVKRTILQSVVGTLDLNIRYLLQGETFPGERGKAPLFCSIDRTPASRYAYIAHLCVAKSARRQGIARNMLHFAVESAKSNGVSRLYVHVGRDNGPAQILYRDMGFEMVEPANPLLVHNQTYLLRLQM